ncbi:MAG: tyrosine-type recombinase/integrase, partial [Chloroflexota bacterium]
MLSFGKAREGFTLYCQVANHSKKTVDWYAANLTALERFLLSRYSLQDPERLLVQDITKEDTQSFIVYLQGRDTLYEKHAHRAPVSRKLSAYTVHAYVRTLSAFFHWAIREKVIASSPMENLPRPKLPKSIKPRFSESEIKALLKACEGNTPLAVRNRALVMVLLDSGLRASELCGLLLTDLDKDYRRALVLGKGAKQRYVVFGARTRQALWQYVNVHRPQADETNAVFLSNKGKQLTIFGLDRILHNLGKRAGVEDVHAHKFRHTAARLALANG